MGRTSCFENAAWNLNTRVTDGSTETFTVNTSNELVNAAGNTCSYDANGNITYDGSRYYLYDAENQLIQISNNSTFKSEFVYDGKQRRRIRKEYTSSNGGLNWTLVKEVRYDYDGFGRLISSSGSSAGDNLYRFSSMEYHGETGRVYYLYRYYDPEVQRWVNRDPIGKWGFLPRLAYRSIILGGPNSYGILRSDGLHSADLFELLSPGPDP